MSWGSLIHVLGVGVGNDISNVQGVCVWVCAINLVLGGGGGCEWYKTCPAGTTNHILGVVY